ncbi:MAG TPA: YHS domain-containing (seleno)protein [Cyclobacteriaceae bacterium]|nr:YHS domain-containing (seleno)protein [Cyclobacteriaceae bacterium]
MRFTYLNKINVLALALSMLGVTRLNAQQNLINVDEKGVVIDGYDPVAYFTEQMAVKGSEEFQSSYNGLVYWFTSEENKKTFDSTPQKYEVQFGGFCAYAVSQGHVSPIDPNFCVVQKDEKGVDRLICQHNQKASNLWNENPDGLLVDAYKYWPAVVKNGGKQIPIKGVEHFFINIDESGLAVQGFDVVAYHTQEKAIKGDPKFTEWFHGAKYNFTTADNRDLFRDNPRKYLPEYGGFCGYAMSLGRVRPVNPEIFQLVDGRLILQHTQEAYDLFNKDLPNNVVKADNNWPEVESKHAGKKIKFDKPAM